MYVKRIEVRWKTDDAGSPAFRQLHSESSVDIQPVKRGLCCIKLRTFMMRI